MKHLVGLALFVAVTCGVAFGQEATQYKMTTYQLLMLKKGPNAASVETPDGQKIVMAHVQYVYKLGAAGTYKAAGPFTDSKDVEGVIIVAADTPEKAIAIEAEDPGVKAGFFTIEALPFMSPEGWFPGTWAEFGKFEQVYFGFLNNGPNRSQDKETADRLQQEHLAYMAGQAKEGALILAGPFMVEGGIHRGVVVYRVSNPEELQRRANGDPMIKAGRLVLDLHPWQVPVGALPVPK